jgi:hypothetical protein
MTADEMRVRVEDYETGEVYDFELPDCDFCDDRGCEECHPDDFAQMNLRWVCDGSRTIEEALEALQEFTNDLRNYQDQGFELSEPIDNAYFWLERSKTTS